MDKILSHLKYNQPIIYVYTIDFEYIRSCLAKIESEYNFDFWLPGSAEGRFHNEVIAGGEVGASYDLDSYLDNFINQSGKDDVLVLQNIDDRLLELKVMDLLTKLYDLSSQYKGKVIILSENPTPPPRLIYKSVYVKKYAIQSSEIDEIAKDQIPERLRTDENIRNLQLSLYGLTLTDINKILDRLRVDKDNLDETIKYSMELKEQFIKKIGGLRWIKKRINEEELFGFKRFKKALEKDSVVLNSICSGNFHGLTCPKGMLIAGASGCGKSSAAKLVAQKFGWPLLYLDVGALLGKYVGDSEKNFQRVLDFSDNYSPCVLWIDEIEKVFAGGGVKDQGSDYMRRVVGSLLNWLQERDSMVYVVATANDTQGLPPELFRDGRFDRRYYVAMPNIQELHDATSLMLQKNTDLDVSGIKDFIRKFKTMPQITYAELESFIERIQTDLSITGGSWKYVDPVEAYRGMTFPSKSIKFDKYDFIEKGMEPV